MGGLAKGLRAGFTLIELLLVLGLIGLMSSVFVINLDSMLRDTEIEAVQRAYWRAVDSARTRAVFEQTACFLDWDEEKQAFVVRTQGAEEAFPIDEEAVQGVEIEVVFEEQAAQNSFVLVRGQLQRTREIARVGFFPDGTCSPYIAELRVGEYIDRFVMDPWTATRLVGGERDDAI